MNLLEIAIAMLILSSVTIGIANVLIASKRHTGISGSKMVATSLGREYIDRLQVNVTQNNWGLPGNDLNPMQYPDINVTNNPNMNYTISRKVDNVSDVALNNITRRVKVNITWNEP